MSEIKNTCGETIRVGEIYFKRDSNIPSGCDSRVTDTEVKVTGFKEVVADQPNGSTATEIIALVEYENPDGSFGTQNGIGSPVELDMLTRKNEKFESEAIEDHIEQNYDKGGFTNRCGTSIQVGNIYYPIGKYVDDKSTCDTHHHYVLNVPVEVLGFNLLVSLNVPGVLPGTCLVEGRINETCVVGRLIPGSYLVSTEAIIKNLKTGSVDRVDIDALSPVVSETCE